MKVTMLKTTNYFGLKAAGSEQDIEDNIAKRWIDKGIAAPAEEKEPEGEQERQDYTSLKAKELMEICKGRGIELDKEYLKSLEGDERKAYVISKLEEADAASTEEE